MANWWIDCIHHRDVPAIHFSGPNWWSVDNTAVIAAFQSKYRETRRIRAQKLVGENRIPIRYE